VKITSCVPLAGQGVIARYGGLVAVTDNQGPDPDPLLGALAEASASAGDGGDLVLRAARAALGRYGRPAWACAGVTADGGVAVLVHGRAVATVRVDGGPEIMLTVGDSVIPVSRKFTGATVFLGLVIGQPTPPDPRFWLGEGVVRGRGLALTVTADVSEMAMIRPDAPPPALTPDALMTKVPPTALEIEAPAGGSSSGGPNSGVTVSSGDWFGQRPPADLAGGRPLTADTQAVELTAADIQVGGDTCSDDPWAVLVDGVLCAGDHFNDPGARACRQCGIGLDQTPRNVERRQRPPLGVLIFDDGTRIPLDGDYVLGREPAFDSDVIDGRARPLRINDPNGTVSRLHLRISLTGWQVEVSDLGSANGSVLQSPGGERTLAPFQPTIVQPGVRIGIGQRSMHYVAYLGVHP
jgi:FHA domain